MRAAIALLASMAVVLSSSASVSETPTHACFSECVSCSQRCSGAKDRDSCVRTCREVKRSCCKSCGKGPGPLSGCGCT